MFVYKVLWIFTVKCLQFNKELYVYFVQVPFCESLNSRKHLVSVILKRLKTHQASQRLKFLRG